LDRLSCGRRSTSEPGRAGDGVCLSPSGLSGYPLAVLLAAALMIFASALASAQNVEPVPEANGSPTGDAESGKRIYSSRGCYECHGGEGQGSILTGPRVGPDPIPFPGFVRYLRQPAGQMPPYTSKVISDAELADLHAFLKSLPQPRSAKSVPLLNGQEKTSR
jgi:ubiquinol-cytochrome c reductase cytochrome c subunit